MLIFALSIVAVIVVLIVGFFLLGPKLFPKKTCPEVPCDVTHECVNGVCVVRNSVGCPVVPCKAGQHCLNSSTCVDTPPCPGVPCIPPQVCVNGMCRVGSSVNTNAVDLAAKAGALVHAITAKTSTLNQYLQSLTALQPILADFGRPVGVVKPKNLPPQTKYDDVARKGTIEFILAHGVGIDGLKLYSDVVNDVFTMYLNLSGTVTDTQARLTKLIPRITALSVTSRVSDVSAIQTEMTAIATTPGLSSSLDQLDAFISWIRSNDLNFKAYGCLILYPIDNGLEIKWAECVKTAPSTVLTTETNIVAGIHARFDPIVFTDFTTMSQLISDLLTFSKTILAP